MSSGATQLMVTEEMVGKEVMQKDKLRGGDGGPSLNGDINQNS